MSHALNDRFDTQDVLYDLAWSEQHENQILTANGDGSIKLFDISVDQFPIQSWDAHGREVFAVHWNLLAKDTFVSSSWDGAVKVFNPQRDQAIVTLPTHSCTYSAQFSPHEDRMVSAVSADSMLRLWDLRTPASVHNHLVLTIPYNPRPIPGVAVAPMKNAQEAECLTHDWNKYRNTVVAVGGVDRLIRTFDIRNATAGPVAVLNGHDYAVRKVTWSPHLPDLLLSASYDMSCRVWTDGSAIGVDGAASNTGYSPSRQVGRMDRHTEFATGVDWCLFGAEGWCASTAWDERVLVWDVRAFITK